MVSKSRALNALQHQSHLTEIYEFENERMDTLVDLALSCESAAYRWRDYEVLKKFVCRFVGKEATQPELRTSAHYEVVIAFIDWLLPESEASC